jgi:hypothetical protein
MTNTHTFINLPVKTIDVVLDPCATLKQSVYAKYGVGRARLWICMYVLKDLF